MTSNLSTSLRPLSRMACLAASVIAVSFASMPASAAVLSYQAVLSGAAESPSNPSPGTGLAAVTLDDVTAQMTVDVVFSGLTGTTTASHIHCCTAVPGVGNIGVATEVPTFVGFPLGVTSGLYSEIFDLTLPASFNPAFLASNGGSVSIALAALLAGLNSGSAYLNIHTTEYPGGEIRGFLALQTSDTDVPLPAGFWLLATAAGGLGVMSRKKRKAA